MKLYSYWRSSASYRVRIALNLKQLDYQLQPIHLLRDGGEQYGSFYSELNPQQRVPALELADGTLLTQSLAIIEYLDELCPEPALLPQDPQQRAWVRALAQLVACDIHPVNNLRVLRYLQGELGHSKPAIDCWYRYWLADGLSAFEAMVERTESQCCFGMAPTLADICLIPQLYNAHRYQLDMQPYPTLRRIERYCLSLEPFIQAHPQHQPDADD
jgi:maleylacetoacetate isomerase